MMILWRVVMKKIKFLTLGLLLTAVILMSVSCFIGGNDTGAGTGGSGTEGEGEGDPVDNRPLIDTPVIYVDKYGKVTWSAVPNARSYTYKINGSVVGSTESLSVTIVDGRTISVKANSASEDHRDSEYSDPITYNAPAAVTLSTPKVTVDDSGKASWKPISGALGYAYQINGGVTKTTKSLSVKLYDGDRMIVKALGDGLFVLDSEFSALLSYTSPRPLPMLNTPVLSLDEDGVVTWDAVDGAIAYAYKINGGDEKRTLSTTLTLVDGESVTVKAIGNGTDNENSVYSASVTYTAPTPPAPPAPGVLAVPQLSIDDNGRVSWNAVENALSYSYKINGGDEISTTELFVLISDGDSICVKAVGNGDTYVDSAYSEDVNYTAPVPPKTLISPIVSVDKNGTAKWSAVTGALIYGYKINDGEEHLTSSLFINLADGDTLVVRALGDGESYLDSSYSEPVTYTEPTEPVKLSTPTLSLGENGKVTWTQIPGAKGYIYKINGGPEQRTLSRSVTLSDGQSIVVKAYGDGVNYLDSDFSESVTHTSPVIPKQLSVPVVTISKEGLVTWTPIEGATGYAYKINSQNEVLTDLRNVTISDKDKITVKAVGDGIAYLDSNYSTAKTYNAPTKLDTPKVTIDDDGVASWNAVSGASSYAYKINGGEEQKTQSTKVTLSIGDKIAVKAVSDIYDMAHSDSPYSAEKTYTVLEVVYAPETTVKLLLGEGSDSTNAATIASILNSYLDSPVRYITNSDPPKLHEIILGNSNRPVTAEAYRRLDIIRDKTTTETGYAIYSDGTSIAVVWDEDENDIVKEAAISYFIRYCLASDTLDIPAGTVHSEKVSATSYWEEYDAKNDAAAWQKLESYIATEYSDKSLAGEIVSAMKELYAFYRETGDVVSWYANLLDSDICICNGECQNTKYCGGAGFYFSNSARDTYDMNYPSYSSNRYMLLPDLESTSQALGFIQSSGMANMFGGNVKASLPEWLYERLYRFAYNMQESDGYFYHPQWDKNKIEYKSSRLSRDLSHGFSLINTYGGGVSKYPYPGTSTASTVSLTSPLGSSAESAASRVTAVNCPARSTVSAVASVWQSPGQENRFNSVADFKTYLNGFDVKKYSYPIGNELTALTSEIKALDDKNGWSYQGGEGYMYELVTWLNKNQNPKTGCWQSDENDNDIFYRVNGLLKISGIYNVAKTPMPYAKEAIESAIYNITTDQAISAGVDLYNIWFSIKNVLTNITKYGTDTTLVTQTRTRLMQLAPEAIRSSITKLSTLHIPDGSFGYSHCTEHDRGETSVTSQAMPVALPHIHEGDINGTLLSLTGVVGNMHEALGIAGYKVPLFGEADRQKYVGIITKNYADKHGGKLPDGSYYIPAQGETTPAFKDNSGIYYSSDYTSLVSTKTNYDGQSIAGLATIHPGCSTEPTSSASYAYINSDGRLELSSREWTHLLIRNEKPIEAPMYVVETDIMFAEASKTKDKTIGWISLTSASSGAGDRGFVRIYINLSEDGRTVNLDLPKTDGTIATLLSLSIGEWTNIRIVAENVNSTTVKVNAYKNGKLTASNVQTSQNENTHTSLSGIGIELRGQTNGGTFKAYLDNTYMGARPTAKEYSPAEYTIGNGVYYNASLPMFHEYKQSYDEVYHYSSVAMKGSAISIEAGNESIVAKNNSSAWGIWTLKNKTDQKSGSKYVFETDISFDEVIAENGANIAWLGLTPREDNAAASHSFARLYLNAIADSSGSVTAVTLASTSIGSSSYVEYAKFELGKDYNLRIEYEKDDSGEGLVDVYINGTRVARKTGACNISGSDNSVFNGIIFEHRGDHKTVIRLDNTYFGVSK